jgi:hypothetical protein
MPATTAEHTTRATRSPLRPFITRLRSSLPGRCLRSALPCPRTRRSPRARSSRRARRICGRRSPSPLPGTARTPLRASGSREPGAAPTRRRPARRSPATAVQGTVDPRRRRLHRLRLPPRLPSRRRLHPTRHPTRRPARPAGLIRRLRRPGSPSRPGRPGSLGRPAGRLGRLPRCPGRPRARPARARPVGRPFPTTRPGDDWWTLPTSWWRQVRRERPGRTFPRRTPTPPGLHGGSGGCRTRPETTTLWRTGRRSR